MYMIAFKLNGPDGAYENLETAIKALGPWSNRLADCWIVESRFNARRIRDLMKPHLNLEAGDRVFVAQFNENWAGSNMGQNFPEWIKRRDFAPTRFTSAS